MVQRQVGALAQKPSSNVALTVDVISDPQEFLESGHLWDRLVTASGVMHPCMSHAWLTAWWDCFGAGNDLRVFVVKSDREWIAAAPMMICRTKMYGVSVRRLEALFNPHTTRYEFPMMDRSDKVYRMLWRAMSDSRNACDAVVFQQFVNDSPTLDAFEGLAQQEGWRTGRWMAGESPYLRLGPDYDALFNRLSPRERYHLRKRHYKLSQFGEVDMEVISTHDGVSAAMKDGLSIEAAAWKGRAGTAMISDPTVERFYLTLAERAANLGWLRLAFLRVGGKRVAFLYMLDTGGVVYGMKMGYDPIYHKYSPGNILLTLVLRQLCDLGRKEFDFQGGRERWKLVWTKESRTHPWLFLFRDQWRSRLLHRAKFVVLPAVRRFQGMGRTLRPVT